MSKYHMLYVILHCLLIHFSVAVAFVVVLEYIAQQAIGIVYEDASWGREEHIEWLIGRAFIGSIPVLGEICFAVSLWRLDYMVSAWVVNFYRLYAVQHGVMYCKYRRKLWWKRSDDVL